MVWSEPVEVIDYPLAKVPPFFLGASQVTLIGAVKVLLLLEGRRFEPRWDRQYVIRRV